MAGKLLAVGLFAAAICTDAATPPSRPSSSKKPGKGSGKFLWVSDVHYDPYYGTANACKVNKGCSPAEVRDYPYGLDGCDAPWALVDSALKVRWWAQLTVYSRTLASFDPGLSTYKVQAFI